jgi:hypothetical protein
VKKAGEEKSRGKGVTRRRRRRKREEKYDEE